MKFLLILTFSSFTEKENKKPKQKQTSAKYPHAQNPNEQPSSLHLYYAEFKKSV